MKNPEFFVLSIVAMAVPAALLLHSIDNSGLPTGYAVRAGEAPDGFAAPYDIFDNNRQLINLNAEKLPSGNYRVTITYDHPQGYIYYTGYYFNRDHWTPVYLSRDEEWITDRATTSLVIDQNALYNGRFYFIGYSCKQYNGDWKCGCNTKNDCWKWYIQEIFPDEESPGLINIKSDRREYKLGDRVALYVLANTINSFYGFAFDVKYDETKLSFERTGHNPPAGIQTAFSGAESSDYVCIPYMETRGEVKHVSCLYRGRKAQNLKNHNLITLFFRAKQRGEATVTLKNIQLSTWLGIEIDNSAPKLLEEPPVEEQIRIS